MSEFPKQVVVQENGVHYGMCLRVHGPCGDGCYYEGYVFEPAFGAEMALTSNFLRSVADKLDELEAEYQAAREDPIETQASSYYTCNGSSKGCERERFGSCGYHDAK